MNLFEINTMKPYSIRPARPGDEHALLELIRGLADYEQLADRVVATPELLAAHLFGDDPVAISFLAEFDGQDVGFALAFRSFSTFLGKPGIYLEDLFVVPEYRSQGIGKALIETIFQHAAQRGYGRVEWSVLNWNTPAIEFYDRLGAKPLQEWTMYRLDGSQLDHYRSSASASEINQDPR